MSVVADSGADFGVAQAIDIYLSDQVYSRIGHARRYVEDVVWQDPKYRKVRASCRNQHENCAFWAIKGEVRAEAMSSPPCLASPFTVRIKPGLHDLELCARL